jgi:amino acid adenylation domain-containing protein
VTGPFTLHGLVEAAAARTPDAPAVRMKGEALSYRALLDRARAHASILAGAGVRPGDRVGLYQPKSLDGVAALLGIMGAGAAYVPVDPGAPVDRARFILEHCGVSVLYAAGRPLASLADLDRPIAETVIAPPEETVPTGAARAVRRTNEARGGASRAGTDQDLAYVLYTSGSTGTPKGVAITHGQSLAFVRTAAAAFGLTGADVLSSHAPFNFDLSVIDLYCAFAAGASVVLIPEPHLAFPAKVAELIESSKITVWNSVPSALVQLVNKGGLEKRDLSSLRLIMFAGEPFPLKQLARLRELAGAAELWNIYGQTEANSSTYHRIGEIPADVLPIGKPFPNYDVLVLADGRAVREPGVEGELYVIGGAVASGYWNDPERTRAAFVQHPLVEGRRWIVYKTGDRVVFDEHGDLVFRGRMDSAIKCRGFRVELGEVEAVALEVKGVAEACVVPVPHEELSNLLVLYVVPEAAFAEAELRSHLAAKLPRYMIPEAIVARTDLPHTGTGKIDRKALKEDAARALAKA